MTAQIIEFPRIQTAEQKLVELEHEWKLRNDLRAALSRAGNWAVGDALATPHIANYLRVRYSVGDVSAIPADKLQEAISIVAGMHEACDQFLYMVVDMRAEFLNECIGFGAPWTPAIKAKLTRRYREKVPDRPDWLALAARLPRENKRKRGLDT